MASANNAEPARRASRLLSAAGALVAAVYALPLGYVAFRATDADFLSVLTSRRTLEPALRSVVLATSVAVACAVIGTGLAWLTVRTDVPLRRMWRVVAPLPLVIPSFVGAAALLAAFAPGGLAEEWFGLSRLPRVEGFWGAFAVLTLLSYPYVYLPVAARLGGLPASLEESARLLGRRGPEVFRTIVLPQARSAIVAGTLLVFLYALSDFGAVSLLRYRTLTDRIYANRLVPEVANTLSAVLALLAVVVVVGERLAVRRVRSSTGNAGRPLTVPLGRARIPALAGIVALTGLALGAPAVVLGYWAQRGLREGGSLLGSVSGNGLRDIPSLIGNSATAGVVTAVVAIGVVLPVAFLVSRHRSPTGSAAQALVAGGFALPGLVGALALARLSLSAPGGDALYQTFPLLIGAYVLHFGAQASQAAQTAVGAVPPRFADAARVLGASRTRALFSVDLPLMVPGLVAGAGLVLLSTMKELPATLLLAPFGFDTLATRIWQATSDGFLAESGVVALTLLVLSGALTWFLVIRRSLRS